MLETIEISTSKEKFFLEYLILKKPVVDTILSKINGEKTTLSEKPMQVLAQLLYYTDLFKDLNENDKWAHVFSKKVKGEICSKLSMKEHHLNIYLSQLRGIKILEGKNIRNIFAVNVSDSHSLTFKFKINGLAE